jgi:hypothetical protein
VDPLVAVLVVVVLLWLGGFTMGIGGSFIHLLLVVAVVVLLVKVIQGRVP